MKFTLIVLLIAFAIASAFTYQTPGTVRAPRLFMAAVANNKNTKVPPKATTTAKATQVVKGGYVPAGLTPEQYQAVLEKEAAEKNAKKQKFFLGKETESLTEWMQVNEKKGLKGVELNRKGHKMVKAKYDGWYTDYSPV
mmetsp:Transcript_9538/g.10254  ORF Transcript_9538/g.10254 Transcript_9538/m.10254 type:complete len:139 (-) Transcript_9538:476-892(-)